MNPHTSFKSKALQELNKLKKASIMDDHITMQAIKPGHPAMKLPHSKRIRVVPYAFANYYRAVLSDNAMLHMIEGILKEPDLYKMANSFIHNGPADLVEYFQKAMAMSDLDPSGSYRGNTTAMLLALKASFTKPPLFTFDDQLLELLDKSDLNPDIKLADLGELPFEFFSIEFGRERPLQHSVFNQVSGAHKLESAYIFKTTVSTVGRQGNPAIGFAFVGEPKAGLGDDALKVIVLETDLDLGLEDAIKRAVGLSDEIAGFSNPLPYINRSFNDSEIAELLQCLLITSKCLLYLNHGNFAQSQVRVEAELEKQISLTAKRKKLQTLTQELQKTYDHIYIRPKEDLSRSPNSSQIAGSLKAHWRRGHYRNQRHGPQNSLKKILWIPPVIVNAQESDDISPKEYRILAK